MIAENQTFTKRRIQLDGASLVGCKFDECRFVFSGLMGSEFRNCDAVNCGWEFDGSARETIQFLRAVYHHMEGGKELVERTFEEIRRPPTQDE